MIKTMTQEEAAKIAAVAYGAGTASQLHDAMRLYTETLKVLRANGIVSDREIGIYSLATVYAAGVMEGKRAERARNKKAV